MPERGTEAKARNDKRAGKPTTPQAREFEHEEIRKVRRGQHGARSPQQAIAISLSKARRGGVRLRPPRKSKAKAKTRKSAEYAYEGAKASGRPGDGPASRGLCREPL